MLYSNRNLTSKYHYNTVIYSTYKCSQQWIKHFKIFLQMRLLKRVFYLTCHRLVMQSTSAHFRRSKQRTYPASNSRINIPIDTSSFKNNWGVRYLAVLFARSILFIPKSTKLTLFTFVPMVLMRSKPTVLLGNISSFKR